jgi:hypothetical protein
LTLYTLYPPLAFSFSSKNFSLGFPTLRRTLSPGRMFHFLIRSAG